MAMIDKNMIEKYAEDYAYHNCSEEENYAAYQAFMAGINWFLNNLWHDASEEPERTNQENEFVECLVRFKDGIVCFYNYDTWHHWWCSDEDNQKFLGLIDKWAYLSDILPKQEGGEQ